MIRSLFVIGMLAPLVILGDRLGDRLGDGPVQGLPQLNVQEIRTESESVSVDFSVANFPKEKLNWKLSDASGAALRSPRVETYPVNLWILIDSSQLCHTYQIEPYLDALLGQLKSRLNPLSTVSVASFTSTTLEVLEHNRPVSELESVGLHCDPKLVSTTFEKTYQRLTELPQEKGLPAAAWVLSSGNIQLSDKFLSGLRSTTNTIQVILYNAIMETELRPLVDQQNAKAGRDAIRLSPLDIHSPIPPERFYRISFVPPSHAKWNQLGTVLVSLNGGEGESEKNDPGIAAKKWISFAVPKGPARWWQWLSRILFWGSILAVILWVVWRLVRFYRPRFCKQCQKRIRSSDRECGFCVDGTRGYLVGPFNRKDPLKKNRNEVHALKDSITEIGTKTRCHIRLASAGRHSQSVLARIESKRSANHGWSYLLVPVSQNASIRLSGKQLRAPKNLAPGDRIEIRGAAGEIALTFTYGRTENA